MICKNCGNNLAPDAKFCRNCGAKVKKICKNCLNEIENDAIFCPECGFTVEKSEKINNEFIPKQAKKNANVLIAVLVAFIIVSIGAVGAVLIYNNSEKVKNVAKKPTISDNGDKKRPDSPDNPPKEEKDEKNKISDEEIKRIIAENVQYTKFGIYVNNLTTGYKYGYNQNDEFLASAMAQVVILDALSDRVKDSKIDVDEEYTHFNYIPNGKEAPMSKTENDYDIKLREFIENVAIYGDNNKSNTLIDYIGAISGNKSGFDVINTNLEKKGYPKTKINRKIFINQALINKNVSPNMTTPEEINKIFYDLINNGVFGNKSYMSNIFRCVSNEGKPIGMQKYIPEKYESCNANAFTDQSTNDVAIISYGKTQIAVSILSTTQEDKTKEETYKIREQVQSKLLDYILSTQFSIKD